MSNKVSEAKAKDMILEYCLGKSKSPVEASEISKMVFNEGTSTKEVLIIFRLIDGFNQEVAYCSLGEWDGYLYIGPLAKKFIDNGGFVAIERRDKEESDRKKQREDLELDLARSNLEANALNEKNSKFNRKITIINLILGIANISLMAYQLLFSANE